ncbi:hypothetical protein QTP99_09035 [Caldanaerobacter subterraneus KAk]|uniref:hypothetical protein n=1 Tax=Caldanaerobacter subterraneus TaxID=911092 RepID=UPI0032C0DB99
MKFVAINPVTGSKIIVGELEGDTFYKRVKLHQKLRILDAYGIEGTVVEDLRERRCKKIILTEDGVGEYEIDFETFYNKAIRKTFGNSSYQFYLPMKYWRKTDQNQQRSQITVFELVRGRA